MSQPPPPTGPPPGWYPDPSSGRGFRWWNGVEWTDQWSEAPDAGYEGLAPLGEWLGQLFRLMANRAGHFFPLVVLLIVPISLINSLSAFFAFRDLVVTTDADTNQISVANSGAGLDLYSLTIGTFLALFVAAVALVVAAIRQAQSALEDDPELWSDSLLEGLRRLPRALALVGAVTAATVALYLVMVVSAVAAPGLLLLTFPVWLAGTVWLAARFSLTSVAVGLAGPADRTLGTSWRLTRGFFWAVVGRMVMLVFFSVSISLLMRIVAAPFIAIVGGAGTTPLEPGADEIRVADLLGENPAVFAIGQLFSALGNGAVFVMWAIGFLLIYRDLQGPVEPVGGEAAA